MIRTGDKNSVNEFNNQLLIFVPQPPPLLPQYISRDKQKQKLESGKQQFEDN